MKVLLMVHSLPQKGMKAGGVPVSVQRLAMELAQRKGVSVEVGCLEGTVEDDAFGIWNPVGQGFLCRLCKTRLGIYFLYPFLLNFVRFPPADIVHFHGEDWFLLKRPWPVVRTMHGASKRERRYTNNRFRKIQLILGGTLERVSVSLADRTLCVGSDTQRIFKSPHYIGNGYSSNLFRRGEKAAHPVVFYNGYWKGRKRGELAYQVFVEQVLPEFPDAELWFLGDHCPEHPRVKFFSGVTDEVLGRLYREAWVFLYPSSYEGFGMAYVEAMASGTPVVTSMNSGARDVLVDGHCGLIVQDSSLGEEVVKLLKSSVLRAEWAERGFVRAADFSIERVVDEHLVHYSELCCNLDRQCI